MRIRKMKKQIAVEGVRIFKDEIIIIASGLITVISHVDLAADNFKVNDKKLSTIIENSEEIPIS